MDSIDINNPLSSSYSENILMEKLGIRDAAYKESDSMNHAIQVALLQQELETNKRKVQELEKNKHTEYKTRREHFTGGCDCGGSEGMQSKERKIRDDTVDMFGLNNKKVLLILVVILAAFCIIQYFSYKNEMKEMMMMICTMIRDNKTTANTGPINTVPINTEPTTA